MIHGVRSAVERNGVEWVFLDRAVGSVVDVVGEGGVGAPVTGGVAVGAGDLRFPGKTVSWPIADASHTRIQLVTDAIEIAAADHNGRVHRVAFHRHERPAQRGTFTGARR